jgi:hypothetical protein
VRLGERGRDAVRIGMPAKGDEHVLALRGGERLREASRTVLLGEWQTPNRFTVHRGFLARLATSRSSRREIVTWMPAQR